MVFSPLRSTESRGRKNIRLGVDRGFLSRRRDYFSRGPAQLSGSGPLGRKKFAKTAVSEKAAPHASLFQKNASNNHFCECLGKRRPRLVRFNWL
jgi:hypothetical protein